MDWGMAERLPVSRVGYWWDCGELTLLTDEQMMARLKAGLFKEFPDVGPECPTCHKLLHYEETAA